jgi:hypothetical protein
LSNFNKTSECTYVNIWVNKIKVRAIIDSGAPGNIISTKFMKRLKLMPDILHEQNYGTAGIHGVTSKGAYSVLPIRFGSLQVAAPAIVIPNNSYDMLIGTSFMRQFKAKTNHEDDTFTILGHKIPMYYTKNGEIKNIKENKIVYMVYKDGTQAIEYFRKSRSHKTWPNQVDEH